MRATLYYHNPLRRAIGKTDTFHPLADFEGILRRTEVEDQNLIVPMMHVLLEFAFERRVFAGIQFTQEHAELNVVAAVSQGLEDTIPAFVV